VCTWSGERAFDNCENIQIEDPGPEVSENGYVSNLKRQVLGVRAGLDRAERPYVLKLRPEIKVIDDSVLNLIEAYKDGIIVMDSISRAPWRAAQLFWISDLITLGSYRNVSDYWSIDALDVPRFQKKVTLFERIFSGYHGADLVLNSEQILAISYLVRRGVRVSALRSGVPAPTYANYLTNLASLETYFHVIEDGEFGLEKPHRLSQPSVANSKPPKIGSRWCWLRRYLRTEFLLGLISSLLRHFSLPWWNRIRMCLRFISPGR
jgi:hypothetical protein